MRNTILLIAILIALLPSCEEDGFELNTERFLIFGTYAGECIGPQCVRLYRITSTELFEGVDETYPGSVPYNGDFELLPQATFEAVKDLIEAIPNSLIDADSQTFGCPDCADQGGYYLEYNTPTEVKAWFIDTNEDAIPEYLNDLTKILNEKLIFLKN